MSSGLDLLLMIAVSLVGTAHGEELAGAVGGVRVYKLVRFWAFEAGMESLIEAEVARGYFCPCVERGLGTEEGGFSKRGRYSSYLM